MSDTPHIPPQLVGLDASEIDEYREAAAADAQLIEEDIRASVDHERVIHEVVTEHLAKRPPESKDDSTIHDEYHRQLNEASMRLDSLIRGTDGGALNRASILEDVAEIARQHFLRTPWPPQLHIFGRSHFLENGWEQHIVQPGRPVPRCGAHVSGTPPI